MRATPFLFLALLAACAPAPGAPGPAGAAPPGPGLGGPRAGPPPGLLPDGAPGAAPGRATADDTAAAGCARHADRFPALIGGSAEAARSALLALPGIAQVRVAGPNTALTRDFRSDRATVMTRNNRVERIDCG